jgi:YfiH family protein
MSADSAGEGFAVGALAPIVPDWPAPPNVRAYSTTRVGGVSGAPFDSLNLSFSSGDDERCVEQNRARVISALAIPEPPRWLNQVHGTRVVDAELARRRPQADASTSNRPSQVLALMTADCIPVLVCDRHGRQVAAAHAGWRGLAAGVLESTIGALQSDPSDLLAWLGPGIGPEAFEVGPEVRQSFLAQDPQAARSFQRGNGDRLLADLYQLARQRLGRAGVNAVFGGEYCTYSDPARFFSYRRDGKRSGRMGSFIWLQY